MERHYRSSSGRSLAHRGYGARVLRQRDDYFYTDPVRLLYVLFIAIIGGLAALGFECLSPRAKRQVRIFAWGALASTLTALVFWVAFGLASLRSSLVEVSRGVWAGVGLPFLGHCGVSVVRVLSSLEDGSFRVSILTSINLELTMLLVIAGFLVIVQPGSSGVIASLRLADGSEYMVTQGCNWSPEPYTPFYMRFSGGKGGWCYIDHQANRWRDVTVTNDTDSELVTVTERGI